MGSVVDVDAGGWKQEILQSDVLTVVDFWHDRCPWCLRFNPIVDEVAEEYKGRMKFVKLNVLLSPENREIAIRHGIMGTPTLVFFCEGRPVETAVGFTSKERLKQTIDNVLARHKECVKQSTELKP